MGLAELIIVINNPINVSKFNGPPPASIYDSRIICDGPIYCREEWLALAKAKKLNFWTRDSARDAANLSLSAGDIADLLVLALEQGRFRGAPGTDRHSYRPPQDRYGRDQGIRLLHL